MHLINKKKDDYSTNGHLLHNSRAAKSSPSFRLNNFFYKFVMQIFPANLDAIGIL